VISAAGVIYVLGFSDGLVKVGFTGNPDSRIHTHRVAASRDDVEIVDRWTSEPHENAGENEQALIAFCDGRGTLIRGREWFAGVSFSDVVRHAATLSYVPVAQPAVSLEEARRRLGEFAMARAVSRAGGVRPCALHETRICL